MRERYDSKLLCLAIVAMAILNACQEEPEAPALFAENPAEATLNAVAVREEVNEVVLRARAQALLCGDMMRSHPDALWPESGDKITLTADMSLYAKNGRGLVRRFSLNPSEFHIPEDVRSCIEQAYLSSEISFKTSKGDFQGKLDFPMCIRPPADTVQTQ